MAFYVRGYGFYTSGPSHWNKLLRSSSIIDEAKIVTLSWCKTCRSHYEISRYFRGCLPPLSKFRQPYPWYVQVLKPGYWEECNVSRNSAAMILIESRCEISKFSNLTNKLHWNQRELFLLWKWILFYLTEIISHLFISDNDLPILLVPLHF